MAQRPCTRSDSANHFRLSGLVPRPLQSHEHTHDSQQGSSGCSLLKLPISHSISGIGPEHILKRWLLYDDWAAILQQAEDFKHKHPADFVLAMLLATLDVSGSNASGRAAVPVSGQETAGGIICPLHPTLPILGMMQAVTKCGYDTTAFVLPVEHSQRVEAEVSW